MENQAKQITEIATLVAPYNTETSNELVEILKSNGGEKFALIDKCIFTTNEHGILEGIGFDVMGNFKVWNNTKFGTFKEYTNNEF